MNNFSRQISIGLTLTIFFHFLFIKTTAQDTKEIIEAKSALKNAKSDTAKGRILRFLSENTNENEWPVYNEQLLNLSEPKFKSLSKKSDEYKIFASYYGGALSNKGIIENMKGNIKTAIELNLKGLKIQEEINDLKGITGSLTNLGSMYDVIGELDKGISCLERAKKIALKTKDKKMLSYIYNNLGSIMDKMGKLQEAIEIYETGIKINKEIGDKKSMGDLYNNIGIIYRSQGDVKKALYYIGQALKVREETKDEMGQSYSLNGMAGIYLQQKDSGKALEFFRKSLALREKKGAKTAVAACLNNIGLVYEKFGELEKAIYYFNKVLKLMEGSENYALLSGTLNNIGLTYYDNKDFTTAIKYYKESLAYAEKLKERTNTITILNNIGGCYIGLKNYKEAIIYCNRGMELAEEFGFPDKIRHSADLLRIIYTKLNNPKLALENYELFIKMRDSINNIENQKATIKQQTEYEYEKQKAIQDEKHNAQLKIQNEKASAEAKKQNIIILSVSVVLLLVALFSTLLYNRFKTTQKQKLIIENKEKETQIQKHIIEEKQKEILDSINYAKRIQYTLLAHNDFLKENLQEHFTYFNPKDIVSGDFYWATSTGDKENERFYLAVCDSTGHGVPGAFMSLLNIGFLNEAINEKGIEKPNEIFNYVRQKLMDSISKEGQKDGFDGILLCFDKSKNNITYAAANNAPIMVQGNESKELNADRMPVGIGERKEKFNLYTIDGNKGDMIYLYTDGYADQFGGPKGKKFKYKPLNELLASISDKPMNEQKIILENNFSSWKGELEQVDDVCIIGFRAL